MKASLADVLRVAVRDLHPNEEFERALGRAVREFHGSYADYVDLIGRVRARAERDKMDTVAAAKALSSEEH